MNTTTTREITIQETGEIVRAHFVNSKDEYAFVDDYETIRVVARVPGTMTVFETLADLGPATSLMHDSAFHAVHALYNGNAEEDTIHEYVRAIAPKWAA